MNLNHFISNKSFVLRLVTKSAVFAVVALLLLSYSHISLATSFNTPECVFGPQDGRIIVNFSTADNNGKLLADSSESEAQSLPVSVDLTAGNYKVSLFSYDGYVNRINVSQPNESWFVIFKDGGSDVVSSNAIGDLADNVQTASLSEVVNESLNLPVDITAVKAFHSAYPGDNANSVVPVCVAFDLVEEDVPAEPLTIISHKIVCDDESYLPNWGAGSSDITANTANDFVSANSEHCAFEEGWSFQWAYEGTSNPGDEDGETFGGWYTFGPTDQYGMTMASIDDLSGASYLWVREVFQDGYVPFSYTDSNGTGDDYSAELYCHMDVLNYDNYDRIDGVELENTYYCVGFNALVQPEAPQCSDGIDNDGDLKIDADDPACHTDGDPGNPISYDPTIDDENSKPIITVLGANPLTLIVGNNFTDPGATANDDEDGDITGDVVVGGDSVDNNTLGTYVITYNVSDSQGLAADEVTRTVKVADDFSAPTCPFVIQDGRTIVYFDTNKTLLSDSSETDSKSDTISISLGAGKYITSLFSYDGYSGRVNDSQPNESWFVSFDSGATRIATSSAVGDLADNIATATLSEIVNDSNNPVVLSGSIDSVTAHHAVYPDDSSANSVVAVCAAFDVVPAAPVCSDGKDNDLDGVSDIDDPACHTDGDPGNPISYDPDIDDENEAPEITLLGNNPIIIILNNLFTDPGATASDPEDGDITGDVVVGGDVVNTTTTGTSTITYNVSDSKGKAASEKLRLVVVIAESQKTQCSDAIDNDGDLKIDADDPACHTDGDPGNPISYDPTIDDENSKPIITVLGANPLTLIVGNNFTDPGATANDDEDGDITGDVVVGGDSVSSTTPIGTYTITYDVSDSDGLAADQATRTVNVVNDTPPPPPPPPPPTGCTSNCGGGGGGNPIYLGITNEKVEQIGSGTVKVTWNTNLQATSLVHYDTQTYATATLPFDKYGKSTTETNIYTLDHSVIISGLSDNVLYYFRPQSNRVGEKAGGIELQITLGATTTPPIVPPSGPVCEEYLLDYIKFGENNNPNEVLKLQIFLRDFEGFTNIPITGVYDQATFDAVSVFQERYREDILSPWALPSDTGYVYYTTRKKINEIYCNREFPLNANQLAEIEEFKNLLLSAPAGTIDTSTVGFGEVEESIDANSSLLAEVNEPTPLGITKTDNDTSAVAGLGDKGAAAVTSVDKNKATTTDSKTFSSSFFAGVAEGWGDQKTMLPIAIIAIAGLIVYLMSRKSSGVDLKIDHQGQSNKGDKQGAVAKPLMFLPYNKQEKNEPKKQEGNPNKNPVAIAKKEDKNPNN